MDDRNAGTPRLDEIELWKRVNRVAPHHRGNVPGVCSDQQPKGHGNLDFKCERCDLIITLELAPKL